MLKGEKKISVKDCWWFRIIFVVLCMFLGNIIGPFTIGFVVSAILKLISGVYPPMSDEVIQVVNTYVMFIVMLILMQIYLCKGEKKSIRQLWFSEKKNRFTLFLAGMAMGFALCMVSVGVAALAGLQIAFRWVELGVVGVTMVALIIQSVTEEVFFRGYLLQGLQKNYSTGISAFISSMVFALLHITNPGITPIAVINITIFGCVFAYIVVKCKRLEVVIGMHFIWNFTEQVICGTPNSGIVFPQSIFTIVNSQQSLFYDERFGIEGGIQTPILWVVLLLILVCAERVKKRRMI